MSVPTNLPPTLKVLKPKVSLATPLIVALDVDSEAEADKLVSELAEVTGCFKLGPRLIHRYGERIIQKYSKQAPVFVDCKFFDIPSTMEASVRASFEAGATFVTVHAMAGPTALKRLAEMEEMLNHQRPFMILAVTILTSWDENEFAPNFHSRPISQHVVDLAAQVRAAGLTGLVCSPLELELLKGLGHYLVTPGVRLEAESADDQTRVMTPTEAVQHGANAFVVGRPIIRAADPRISALDYIVDGMDGDVNPRHR